MDVETLEIRQHLARFPPFEALSDELLDAVAGAVDVAYFRAGSDILRFGEPIHDLHYVRSGAVDVYRRSGALYNRLEEGDVFGHFSLLRNHKVHFPTRAIEDTLIYLIPDSVFQRLCGEDEQFADFVELEQPRLKSAFEKRESDADMLATRVRTLVGRAPLTVDAGTSVMEAARRLTEDNQSALLVLGEPDDQHRHAITDAEGQTRRLLGIITDSDFRARVLARGLPPDTPVAHVASEHTVTIQSDETLHEAMLCMLRNNVQHLPVLHRRRPIGILHLSDLVRHQTHTSLYLVQRIFSQDSAAGLAALLPDVRQAFVRMVEEGANSQMIGSSLSTIGRSFTRRLLELGEVELGPPPVPYCFMALGSMARNEQTIVTDQDNALVLDDGFNPQRDDAYFAELGKFVSDGLDACGYTYCKGGIMATNPKWRQPLRVWKQYFGDWIGKPTPERLLHSSIFFDLDNVHGEEGFAVQLQDLVAERATDSPLFLAAMARNALNRKPPLGFFRNFVMEKDGKQNNTINVKRRGTAPMVDLIRVHALACGSTAQNSFDRLNDIADTQLLPSGVGERIRYALEFLSMVRIRHQVIDLQRDRPPDNSIEPENIPSSERHNLKDAFQVLSDAQKFLQFRYPLPARRG
ncbi:MAG: cyclic nucleotide-binding/CBS domain-containing protein [Ectothiorhodospiraceae bacterium]|nr:cyclic nucleotide-binding/CBS domain-containing protein [Ectothiorhodospiraceae bacterium]